MKIILVHCADREIAKTQMFGVNYMPVWAYTLGSYLRSIKEVNEIEIYDNRINNNKTPKADIYLFSGINQDYNEIVNLQKKISSEFRDSKYLIGGPICWSFNVAGKINDLFMFDHIVIGDGENIITKIIRDIINKNELPQIIENQNKFQILNSITMDKELIRKTYENYYGGIIEVSRGCPFLCEFCDIRIQLDNNKAHNKSIGIIISELDYFYSLGINQILFACDNFIGDPKWAEEVCDQIIEWKNEKNANISLYTWLTINIANHDRLLKKLKLAGFDMFFIGVESFGTNQLLETAKIQNVKTTMIDSIKKIQSFGFIVVAGLIFGFDSDPVDVVDVTLDGILKAGLISGDPSLLTALPGTPLYKRMKYSNRLRDGKLGLGGFKYRTNIKYLKKEKEIIANFKKFVDVYNSSTFQYERLKKFYEILNSEKNFIPNEKVSYIDLKKLLKIVLKNKEAIFSVVHRLLRLFINPVRLFFIIKAYILTKKQNFSVMTYFNFWLFNWSNSIIKYSKVTENDYDIGYVGDDFNYENLIPEQYLTDKDEPIPQTKIDSQRKFTVNALSKIKKAQ